VVSELPWASKIENTTNFAKFPYPDNAYTGAGSTSARSRKSMALEDSCPFTVDDDTKQTVLEMFHHR
jgi:hypothetical protein